MSFKKAVFKPTEFILVIFKIAKIRNQKYFSYFLFGKMMLFLFIFKSFRFSNTVFKRIIRTSFCTDSDG